MIRRKEYMKKFFGEFKKFITRGNVLDMAVGVIVGGAFTAIVNALSNNVLKPIINLLLKLVMGANSLSEVYTFLSVAYKADAPAEIDLANSIYIDWGAFINAIINFLLVALVLFLIVRTINRIKDGKIKLKKELKSLTKEKRAELKANGVDVTDRKAVRAYFEKKQADLKAEEDAKKKQEEEQAKLHSTEGLLEQIKTLLEQSLKKEDESK